MNDPDWSKLVKFQLVTEEPTPPNLGLGLGLGLEIIDNQRIALTGGFLLDLTYNKEKLLFHVLKSPDYKKNYLIDIYRDDRNRIYCCLYVNNKFIENICSNYYVAPTPLEIIINSFYDFGKLENCTTDDIEIAKNTVLAQKPNYLKHLNLTPFTHQQNNVHWMNIVEQNVELKLHKLDYVYCTDLLHFNGKMPLYLDTKTDILYDALSLSQCPNRSKSVNFLGGVLCDQVGLGKTLSITSLILSRQPLPLHKGKITVQIKKKTEQDQTESLPQPQPSANLPVKATIICCPRRLVGQWITEINKYTNKLKVIELSTIVHINKYSLTELHRADVIVVSFSLLENKKYIDQTKIQLSDTLWQRVVIDEGHEVLLNNVKKVADRRVNTQIFAIKGKYKWVCTGTPLPNGLESMHGILTFLTNRDIDKTLQLMSNIDKTQFKTLANLLFRRNTEESTKNEVFIPNVIENTTTLDFTDTERAIYDRYKSLGSKDQMIQVCSNILVCDNLSNILGKKQMDLGQVNYTMQNYHAGQVNHFKQLVAETNKTISRIEAELKIAFDKTDIAALKSRLNTQHKKLNHYKDEIVLNRKQLTLFASLNANYIKEQICPITGQKIGNQVGILPNGQCYSRDGLALLLKNKLSFKDPLTRELFTKKDIFTVNEAQAQGQISDMRYKWGTKMSYLIDSLKVIFAENESHRVIIFSQWNKMLKMIAEVLDESGIEHVFCRGNVHVITNSIKKFKTDSNIKVILLSSESCSSGSNLTEASHIFLVDTVVTDNIEQAKAIEEQAVARAVRLGQQFNVKVERMIIKNTIEEEYYKEIEEVAF